MKKIFVALVAIMIASCSFAQGTVVLNNRVPGLIDAPVNRGYGPDPRAGAGEGYTGQLLLVGSNGSLIPLSPATTFRTSSAAAAYYVNPVDVTVPGIPPGSPATLRFIVFPTELGWENAGLRWNWSPEITIILGGGTLPPANLIGLQGFQILIPEPSTIGLGILGATTLLFRFRKQQTHQCQVHQ